MKICIDFDGTCVSHEFPEIGKDIGAVPILKKIVDAGHDIILYTMRGRPRNLGERDTLQEAIDWFNKNNIPLYDINNNKTQWRWTTSKKIFANLYIDDMLLGAPLVMNKLISDRPYINWKEVERLLTENGII